MSDKETLVRQIFMGKVAEIIGIEKTIQLLKESREALNHLPDHKPNTEENNSTDNAR